MIGASTFGFAMSLIWVIGLTDSTPFFSIRDSTVERTADPVRSVGTTPDSFVTFLAVGDIMLSRGVDRAIDRQGNVLLPFSKIADLFESADFSFGNFESPVSGNDHRLGKGLIFNTHRPDVKGLVKYKFKVVSLANNHALDQGFSGLRSTIGFLRENGIETIGVGENKDDAWSGKVIDAGADIVIGSHPHWIQTIEKYRGKYIFYSLGNFIFDQRKMDTKEGMVLRVTVVRHHPEGQLDPSVEVERIELIPVVIEHVGVPQPATENETIAILRKIGLAERTLLPDQTIRFAR